MYFLYKLLTASMLLAALAVVPGAYAQDVTPPTLTGLALTPNPINVMAGSQTLTITFQATDDLSGVDFGSLPQTYYAAIITSPTGNQGVLCEGHTVKGPVAVLSGTWTCAVTIPQFSEAGASTVTQIWVPDAVGNTQKYGTAQLTSLGFNTSLTVLSTPDTTPPTLLGITMAPSSVNVSATSQPATVTLNILDDVSGVSFSEPVGFIFDITSPSGKQTLRLNESNSFKRVSGTVLNGMWQATFTVPQYAEQGAWNIAPITLYDAANSVVTLSRTNIQSLGSSEKIVG